MPLRNSLKPRHMNCHKETFSLEPPLSRKHFTLARHYDERVAKRTAKALQHQSIFSHKFNLVFGDLGLITRMVGESAEHRYAVMRAQVEDASGVPFISPNHLTIVIHQDKVIAGYPQSDLSLCLRI